MQKGTEKIQKFLFFQKINYFYRKNETDKDLKIVPEIGERKNIIKNAHTFGHFGIEKTLKEVSQKYYWRGIGRDVALVVKSCLSCLRFQKVPILDHPAFALPINEG